MPFCTRFRDWWRGWSDADLESARQKVSTWKMAAIVKLTHPEFKAFTSEGNAEPIDVRPLAKLRGWK